MQEADWWVDHAAHKLHHGEQTFACSREIEALAVWKGHALLLSSDTDCLSLWDTEGLLRIARVGVYPQDMALAENQVIVCGGADGRLYELSLPDLQLLRTTVLPGMPERIALQGQTAYVLSLLPEPEIHTALLRISLPTGHVNMQLTRPGIPGAITADENGLWIGVSEQVLHLRNAAATPDRVIEGIGLASRIETRPGGIRVTDGLTDRMLWICT